jgi:drug/metabolite transporter (DMT)-like permease
MARQKPGLRFGVFITFAYLMQSNRSLSWLLLILLSLIWGSSFILMKRGLEAFSSEQVAALRISIAFLVLSPLLIRHYKIDLKKYFIGLLGMGMFGNLIPAFLFTKAETGISSSLTGMLNALTPLFTVIVGMLAFRRKTNALQFTGILIGFGGALILLSFSENSGESTNYLFSLLVVIATLCYAISVNMIRRFLSDLNAVTATVWAMTIIGPFALIYLFTTDFTSVMKANPQAYYSLAYVCILAIVGTAVSVMLFNILIKLAGAVFAASCTYLIPIVAIFWGVIDGESINWVQILAILVVLGGIWLINKQKA